jgi:hypothetical protein
MSKARPDLPQPIRLLAVLATKKDGTLLTGQWVEGKIRVMECAQHKTRLLLMRAHE